MATNTERNNKRLWIVLAVALVLFLAVGAVLLSTLGGGGNSPTEPVVDTQPETTQPQKVAAPAKVWDMENLPPDLAAAGMVYANSNENIPGNIIIGAAEGKGVMGSKAFRYHFVGNYSGGDTYIMSPFSLNDPSFVSDWSDGELLWFWVSGAELMQTVRLELCINGLYTPTGTPYYTIDETGNCVQAGEIPHAWGSSTTRGRIHVTAGMECWIGVPLSAFDNPTVISSIMIHVGNSTIKAGNTLYLDEFWITKMDQVPPLSMEELTYSSAKSLTNGLIWNVNDAADGLVAGDVGATEGRLNVQARIAAGKGVAGSTAWEWVMKSVNGAHSQNVNLLTAAMVRHGYAHRAIQDPTNMLWFWVDSNLSSDQRLHLQLNGVSLAPYKSIFTINGSSGKPVLQEMPYCANDGEVVGVGLVPHDGKTPGLYSRVKISAGWSGWVGIPIENFCVNTDGSAAQIPSGRLTRITMRLNGVKNTMRMGDTLYFDEFWLTDDGQMPGLTDQELCYGYTPAYLKETITYGKIWGADSNKLTPGMAVGKVVEHNDRNKVSSTLAAGKGVSGGMALAYTALSTGKTNSCNLDLVPADYYDLGFRIAKITKKTDVLWFWVDASSTADQILHVQLNDGKVFLSKDKPIYTVENIQGVPTLSEVGFYANGNSLTDGMGLVPTNGVDDGKYARIKLCGGWSGWIGIPIENFCVTGEGVAANASFDGVQTIVFRGYVSNKNLLKKGDSFYFDEFWLTKAGQLPGVSDSALLYKAPGDVAERGLIWNAESAENGEDVGVVGTSETRFDVTSAVVAGKGVSGSNAWAYIVGVPKEGDPQNVDLYTARLTELGYNSRGILAESDILWFWVDSNLSVGQRLHLQLNGVSMASGKSVYTIAAQDGMPQLKEVAYSTRQINETAMGPVAYNNATDGKYARIWIGKDFAGWIGIPVSNFCVDTNGNAVEVPAGRVNRLTMRLSGETTSLAENDALYIDELWITEAGKMPALSSEALLYMYTPEIPVDTSRVALWDLEDLAANTQVGSFADNGHDMTAFVQPGTGVLESQALALNLTRLTPGSTATDTLAVKLADYGFKTDVEYTDGHMLWFWVDSDLSADVRMILNLDDQDFRLKGYDKGDPTATYGIYTIVADETGNPQMKYVCYQADDTVDADGFAGLSFVHYISNGNENPLARVKVSDGWSGWVGIPLANYWEEKTVSGEKQVVTLADYCGSWEKLTLQLYKNGTLDGGSWQTDESLYLDEFWITDSDKLPGLSQEALLYKEPDYQQLRLDALYESGMIFQQNKPWHISGTGQTGETVTVTLNRGDTVAQTKTCQVTDGTWRVSMEAVAGGYDTYTLTVTGPKRTKTLTDIVFGEVWVGGGQSNMAYQIQREAASAVITDADKALLQQRLAQSDKASYIRFYTQIQSYTGDTVLSQPVGGWGNGSQWENVENTSATGFLFAEALQQKLDVPVGIVIAAKGGTSLASWVDHQTVTEYPEFLQAVSAEKFTALQADWSNQSNYIGGWYNSLVAPWAGFEVSGILWYQGEHDINQTDVQRLGIAALSASWSKIFNSEDTVSELPLIAIQVAPYASANNDSKLLNHYALNAAMRQGVDGLNAAGGNALVMPIYDFRITVGNIHPQNKPELGRRAAAMAYGMVYDPAQPVCSGPVLQAVDYSTEGIVTLTFDNVAEGLTYIRLTQQDNERILAEGHALDSEEFYADKLGGFYVFDGQGYISVDAAFHAVDKDKIVITLPAGVTAYGVSYGYGTKILSANLYNSAQYPALPFHHIRQDIQYVFNQSLWNLDESDAVLTDTTVETNANRHTVFLNRESGKGVGGSNALAFGQQQIVSGKNVTNLAGFSSASALSGNGFNTQIAVSKDDDVLWFWVDSDMSCDMRLQVTVNGKQIQGGGFAEGADTNESIYVYTVADDGNGEPVLKKIIHQAYDAAVDSVALVNPKADNTGKYAQLKLANGYSGWIGLPVNLFGSGGIKAGDTITSLTFYMLMFDGVDGTLADQTAGDAIYFDEFFLTEAGVLPKVSKDALLYVGDPVINGTGLWNLESLTAGTSVAEFVTDTQGSVHGASLTVQEGVGLLDSKGLALTVTDVVSNKTATSTATVNLANHGFQTDAVYTDDSVLWFWVDSQLSADVRINMTLDAQGFRLKGYDKDDPTATYEIYTIVADKDGKPAIKSVGYQADDTVDADGVTGVSFVHYLSNGNVNPLARVKISAGWSGWVGIPLRNYWEVKDGNVVTLADYCGAWEKLTLQLYKSGSKDAGSWVENEAFYLDEFWLTDTAVLPGLPDDALLG